MERHTPSYYRARLDTFGYFISKELPGHPVYDTGKKNSPLELLKQGLVHPDLREKFESRVESFLKTGVKLPDTPLSFTELCSFNTWFAMHFEKIAGDEVITTSRDFPVTVKGTREDIIKAITKGSSEDQSKRLRIAKARAMAKLKQLELLKL